MAQIGEKLCELAPEIVDLKGGVLCYKLTKTRDNICKDRESKN